LYAGQTGPGVSEPGEASRLCASEKNPGSGTRKSKSSLCADSHISKNGSASRNRQVNKAQFVCNCHSGHGTSGRSSHDPEALAEARDIIRMPHGADPAETLLLDILADEDDKPDKDDGESGPRSRSSTMPITFFLPDEMFEIWNFTVLLYLESISASKWGLTPFFEETRFSLHFADQHEPELYEGFLTALLQEYIITERIHLKVARNYAILKRDRFRCQVPGCRCRRNLEVHHIIWRSKGGCDEHWNLITLCKVHHSYILHELMALKIEGKSPDNLTFIFDPHPGNGEGPFVKYRNGRKVSGIERENN